MDQAVLSGRWGLATRSHGIAVMIFTGTHGIRTATSWAELAAFNSVGSQFVRFPNTGHGATLFSQCARDVAAAFFDQPGEPVNSGCTEDLVPTFLVPEDPIQ